EEMLACEVPEGDLYYNAIRRRDTIEFDAALRTRTERAIQAVRHLIETNTVPPAEYTRKCRNCPLINLCVPKGTGRSRDPGTYVNRSLDISLSRADNDQ
ncbi:MAG: Dna2/Cas4 domain-containing protein, partial [Phycisphaerales bacterium]|nr:Dna2/Cas4 domain-containing protein [Phycisphaerales bacterium]